MLRKKESKYLGKINNKQFRGWYHFSFASYVDYINISFGKMNVFNDEIIKAKQKFDMHPHKDVEIVSYNVDGEITINDFLGNTFNFKKGQFQCISAGEGYFHEAINGLSKVRIISMMFYPIKKGNTPSFKLYDSNIDKKRNEWIKIVSTNYNDGVGSIKQDVNIYVIDLDVGFEERFVVNNNRQAYLVQIEGTSLINDISMNEKDALVIVEESLTIKPLLRSHLILIEMEKELI